MGKSSLLPTCVSAPPPVYARLCVCVCMHNTYCCLCIHRHTFAPQSSVHTKRASCGYFAGKSFLCLTKSFIAAAVNDWVSGDKTSCSSSILSSRVMACNVEITLEREEEKDSTTLTCVEAGRVELSPDFSP